MSGKNAAESEPVTIKKYANRRLYNTASSSYVTLDHLAQMVREGTDFAVYDAKSGEDITRAVLTQIIVEEESKGRSLLPTGFLRELISLYGDSLQWLVPRYLESSMHSFTRNQEQMRSYLRTTFGSMFPFGASMEEMSKNNMVLFEKAMNMFAPIGGAPGSVPAGPTASDKESAAQNPPAQNKLGELQSRIAELEKEIENLRRA